MLQKFSRIKLFLCILFVVGYTIGIAQTKAELIDEIITTELGNTKAKERTEKWQRLLQNDAYQSDDLQALLNTTLSLSSFQIGEIAQAEEAIEQAETLINNTTLPTDPRALMFIYNSIGSHYFYNKQTIFKGNKYYLKALKIAIQNENIPPIEKSYVYTNCSEIATLLKNYEDVLHINKLALNTYQFVEDEKERESFIFFSYADLFTTYINIDEENKNNDNLSSIHYCLIEATKITPKNHKRLHNEMQGKYYLYQNKVDSALFYFNKLLENDNKLITKEKVAPISIYRKLNAHALIAKTHTKANQLKLARQQLDSCAYLNEKYGPFSPYQLVDLREIQQEFYYKTKNLEKYKATTDELIAIQKEIYQEPQKVMNVVELEQKEVSINHLKDTVSKKDSIIKNRTLASIFLLTLSALVFYIFITHKSNKELKERANKALLTQRLLRSQIQPHFMFNTLNTLRGLINLDRIDEAKLFLNDFNSMLRSVLEFSRVELIYLQEELNTINSYVELQKLRFNNFDFYLEIDNDVPLKEVKIPPMILQPFIENCIVHAFPDRLDRRGIIRVNISKENELLKIKVIDNGIGIEKQKKTEHQSLANSITSERLEILSKMHNKTAFYTINSKPNEGTIVEVTLPINWQ